MTPRQPETTSSLSMGINGKDQRQADVTSNMMYIIYIAIAQHPALQATPGRSVRIFAIKKYQKIRPGAFFVAISIL
jgi:hypothetical protein